MAAYFLLEFSINYNISEVAGWTDIVALAAGEAHVVGLRKDGTVMKKCQTYLDYYYSGADQKKSGLFPLVVWVVPDEGRKQKLTEKIEENFSNKAQIFKTKLAEDNPQEFLL